MSSILNDVKELVGYRPEYDDFDHQIQTAINAELAVMYRIGAGPARGLSITGSSETWDDFSSDKVLISYLKEAIHMRVELLFDSLQSNSMKDIITKQLEELEWSIQEHVEIFSELDGDEE